MAKSELSAVELPYCAVIFFRSRRLLSSLDSAPLPLARVKALLHPSPFGGFREPAPGSSSGFVCALALDNSTVKQPLLLLP